MNRFKEYTNDLTGQRASKHAWKLLGSPAEDNFVFAASLAALLRAMWPIAMQSTQTRKGGLATPNCNSHNNHFLPSKSEKKCSWITKLLAWKEDT